MISLLAIPVLLFLVYLSQNNLDIIAYVLILVPIIMIYIGYRMGMKSDLTPIRTSRASRLRDTDANENQSNDTVPVPDRLEPTEGTFSCQKCNNAPCVCRFTSVTKTK